MSVFYIYTAENDDDMYTFSQPKRRRVGKQTSMNASVHESYVMKYIHPST